MAKQEALGVSRLTPGASKRQGQQLPEVGQAGVVPQSLCEGLCSLIPDAVAPHPEGRGKTVKVSSRSPLLFRRWPQMDRTRDRQMLLLHPWSCGLEMNFPLDFEFKGEI